MRMFAKFQTAVELLYPPRCLGCGVMVESDFGLCGPCWRDTPFIGGTVCDRCGVPVPGASDGIAVECDDCMSTARPWRQGRAAMVYKDQARKMVLALKHGDRPEIARPAAIWLKSAGRSMFRSDMMIVPVPLHRTRLLKRRYNQAALLARALSQETGLAHCPDALIRHRRTDMLDGKTADERFAVLRDAIGVHPARVAALKDRPVLLIDDVMTSGATFSACAAACRAGGSADVFVLSLARVAKDA